MMVGGDSGALRVLAARLEAAASRLDATAAVLGALGSVDGGSARPSPLTLVGPRLAVVREWARAVAGDLRRRAAVLDGDDARRAALQDRFEREGYDPDPGVLGHARRVSRSALRGLREGVAGPLKGFVAVAAASSRAETAPMRVVAARFTGGPRSMRREIGDEIEADGRVAVSAAGGVAEGVWQSLALTPVAQAVAFGVRTRRDGAWRAAEDHAHDTTAALPGTFLSVVPGGEGAARMRDVAIGQVKSPSTAASALVGAAPGEAWLATTIDRDVLELSVPVTGSDEVVAFDYHNGDFLVARPGGDGRVTVERHRWSRLRERQRDALRRHGVVDDKGHPLGRDGTRLDGHR